MHDSLGALARIRDWDLWKHPLKLRVYLLAASTSAMVALGLFSVWENAATLSEWSFVAFCMLGMVVTRETERRFGARRLQSGANSLGVTVQLQDCWLIAAIIVAPLPAAAFVPLAGLLHSLTQWYASQRNQRLEVRRGATVDRLAVSPHKALYNAFTEILSMAVGRLLFLLLVGPLTAAIEISFLAYAAGALAVQGSVLFVYNALFSVVVKLASSGSWWQWFLKICQNQWKVLHATALVGMLIPLVWLSPVPLAIFIFLPALTMFQYAALLGSIVDMSTVDETTGAANKRYWKNTARSCLDYATKGTLPFAVAVVDLDYFKRVNDTYGHLVGDVVLKEVVSRLKATVRSTDLVGRFGGEEFLILLPDSTEEQALAVAERCRAAVEASPLTVTDDQQEVWATASIGVSSSEALTGELEDFLKKADAALYVAKRSGRNRVIGSAALAASEAAVVTALRTKAA